MMTNAYDKVYLNDAMKNLGEAFDFAINDCKISANEFMNLFISTGYSSEFENANPKVIVGLSGSELAINVIKKAGLNVEPSLPSISFNYSPEYWAGWSLAYYQWKKGISFKNLLQDIKLEEIINLYNPLHEASEDKIVEVIDFKRESLKKNSNSRLKFQRVTRGITQKELALKSGVNLRTLQEYENKSKDINKASAIVIYSITNVLGCNIDDVLEV